MVFATRNEITIQDALHLIRCGKMTTQIAVPPRYCSIDSTTDLPAGWFLKIKSGRLAAGSELGYIYWSESGWDANRDKIREAWQESVMNRRNDCEFFAALEDYAAQFFESVKKKTFKHIRQQSELVKQLKSLCKELQWK